MRNFFNFKQIDPDTFLITNDFGCHLFLNKREFREMLGDESKMSQELKDRLKHKLFLLNPLDLFSDDTSFSLRNIKRYLFDSTSLHIFVVTNTCNLQCVYCQAQADKKHVSGFMTPEVGKRAIDIALQSPAENLTFEFQGGEPLRNFQTIKAMIEYAEEVKGDRWIQYTIVSNLLLLTDEILDFLVSHNVAISTSIDGPQLLHDHNRSSAGGTGSYRRVVQGIERIRSRGQNLGAIQTTTRESLSYAREIVREYERLGLNGIFLRPLTPLGFAQSDWKSVGYTPEEFLEFYRTAFDEVLKINRAGKHFPEFHATYFLKKILRGVSDNYMELRSPCGAGIGQLAYYYDGNIYTCDEARMVAEAGDNAFCLGNVDTGDYQSIITGRKCRATSSASVLEGIPGCSDCVYQPYCGVCPVINYAQDGDPFAKHAKNYRCKIYGGILDFLFSLIMRNDPVVMGIMNSWLEDEESGNEYE